MKMKMSILLGVAHMNLGIVMSLWNNMYFKDRLSTICEFIPQVGGRVGWRVGWCGMSRKVQHLQARK